MTSHTPGPWKKEFTNGKWHIRGADGELICKTNGWAEEYESEEAENAALIESSTDLLAMCKELQQCAAYWSEYDVPLGIVDRLNEVIDKAEGK